MAGGRDEMNAEPLDVVYGIVEGGHFDLAAVAGPGVDLPYSERPAEQLLDSVAEPRPNLIYGLTWASLSGHLRNQEVAPGSHRDGEAVDHLESLGSHLLAHP